jgi:hypothetical protein
MASLSNLCMQKETCSLFEGNCTLSSSSRYRLPCQLYTLLYLSSAPISFI